MDMFRIKDMKTLRQVLFFIWPIIILCLSAPAIGQDAHFEEIVINFDVPKLINIDIFVQYGSQTVYIPLQEVFSILEINNNHAVESKRLYGYLFSKKDKYEIDIVRGTVTVMETEYPLPRDAYYYNSQELFLRIDLMELYFGLRMNFDFSKLTVTLALNKDFPAYQKLKRHQAQEKLAARKKKDRELYRLPFQREYFSGGIVDWTLSSNPIGNSSNHYFNLNLGGMVLGGDISMSGNGSTRDGFDSDQLRYQWHYYIDDNPYLTQVELGRVQTGGVFSRGLDGVLVTNKPQVRREYFQTINLSGYLGEGWEVELYIDNRLTDFVSTDHTGRYDFNVDIFYGASSITLKMYGPNGEIKIEEQDVKVPYSLIPQGEMEYTATFGQNDGGKEDGLFTQGKCFYGVTPQLTMGINAEIPLNVKVEDSTSEDSRPQIGAELVFQPLTNLTFNGLYAPNYSIQGGLSFTRPTVFSINGRVTFYEHNLLRNPLDQEHNITLAFSSPLRLWGQQFGLRFNISHDQYPTVSHLGLYYGFSASVSKLYMNYIGRYKISEYDEADRTQKTASSQIIAGLRSSWLVQPQCRIDYDHDLNEVVRYGIYLTRRVFRTGQLSLSYERNQVSKSNLFMVTFNIFTGFADFNTRVVASSDQVAMAQSQHGSVRFNQESYSFMFNRRSGVGQSSAVLRPFIDENFNGIYDDGEEQLSGLRAKIPGAGSQRTGKDKAYYYDRMQPYDEYIVEIDQYSLDNPLLKPVHDGYRIQFNPNMVTPIRVPIVTVSEISGTVRRQMGESRVGIGSIKVQVMNLTTGSSTELTTFNNGDYYYLGLIPGRYRARINPEQLEAHGYTTEPEVVDFEVEATEGGTYVENISFLLTPRN